MKSRKELPIVRWLFHALRRADLHWTIDDRYAPPSLEREGFLHASFQPELRESVRLYLLGSTHPDDVCVLRIDPRVLDVPIEVADTPRGPMPHVLGSIARHAVAILRLDEVDQHPDEIESTTSS